MSLDFLICSYCTRDSIYENHAVRLERSLKKFNLDYEIDFIQSLGDWHLNTRYKALYISEKLQSTSKSIVFLDADSEVLLKPDLFSTLDCDIAAYQDSIRQLLSGTLYFKNNDKSKEIVDLWVAENNKAHIHKFEQYNLAKVLRDNAEKFTVKVLPFEYCYIVGVFNNVQNPVIMQYQASREFRR